MKDILSFDFGNRLVKASNEEYETSFIHASVKLDQAQYKNLVDRGDDKDLYVINNTPYLIGERAQRYSGQFAEGASRYDVAYYERFLGKVLWDCYPEARKDIVLFAGHAPRDIPHREDIKGASVGSFSVVHQGEKRVYRIKNTYCWDEPVGGLMNQLLTADGKGFAKTDYNKGETLVIDIGGLTIDYIIVEDAKPDYQSARSFVDRNIIDSVDQFEQLIRQRYVRETQARNGLNTERLYDAIHSGFYDAGAYGRLDCRAEAEQVCEEIVDSIQSYYRQYGGEQLHFVLLTGGGAGLLEQRIRARMMINGSLRRGLYLAHERKAIHMANVFGALKLAKLYRNHGKL